MKLKKYEDLLKMFEKNISLEKFAEAEKNLSEIVSQKNDPTYRNDLMQSLEKFLEYKAIAKPLSFYAKGKMFFVALSEGADLLIPEIYLNKVEKANKNAIEQGLTPRFTKDEIEYLKSVTFTPEGLPEEVAISFGFKDAEVATTNAKRNPTAVVESAEFLVGFEGYLREHPEDWKKIENRLGKTYEEILRTFAETALTSTGVATLTAKGIAVGVEIGRDPSRTFLRIGALQIEFNAKDSDKLYQKIKAEKLPILEEINNKFEKTGEIVGEKNSQKLEIDEKNADILEKKSK